MKNVTVQPQKITPFHFTDSFPLSVDSKKDERNHTLL